MIEIVQDGTSTVHLKGRFDDRNAPWIIEQVRGLLEAQSAAVVIDLLDVTEFGQAAAAAVEEAGRACRAKSVPMKIAHAAPWLAGSGVGQRRPDPPERETKQQRNLRLGRIPHTAPESGAASSTALGTGTVDQPCTVR